MDRAVAFVLGAGIPLLCAFRSGGYDVVFRQEGALVLWWGLALAFAFGLLPRGRLAPVMRLPLWALAALIAWTALSLLWTESAERTYEELTRTVGIAGLFVLAIAGITADSWRSALTGALCALLVLPLIALVSRLLPDIFDRSFILETDRLSYPLEYWNAVACWCAMAVAAGLGLSAHLRSVDARAASLAAVVVAMVALYLTYSRGGVAAALVGAAAVTVLGRHRLTTVVNAAIATLAAAVVVLVIRSQPEIADGTGGEGGALVALVLLVVCLCCGGAVGLVRSARLDGRSTPRWLPRAAVVMVMLSALAGGLLLGPEVAVDADEQFSSSSFPSSEGDPATRLTSLGGTRDEIWGSALSAFESDAFLGIGPGTFELWWTRDVVGGESLRDAHSLYLEVLAELGLVGLLLLVAFLGGLLRAVIHARRVAAYGLPNTLVVAGAGVFIAFLFQAGFDWMWESTAVLVIALTVALAATGATTAPRSRRPRLGPRRALVVALAIGAGAAQVPAVVAVERERAAFSSFAIGQLDVAEQRVSDANEAEPWAASPFAARVVVALAGGDPQTATAAARDAIDREPTNWRHRVLLATALARLGDLEPAALALERANALGANPPVDMDDLALDEDNETGAGSTAGAAP